VISETAVKPIYKLGNIIFTVRNCDPSFERTLENLIPQVTDAELNADEVPEISMGCIQDVRELINHVLKKHPNCIWVDAACAVSPFGPKVLLSGQSGAGKSTMAMALALGFHWKVLSEDITLIDVERDEIVNFASPFSFKAGTAELLANTVNADIKDLILNEWMPQDWRNAGSNSLTPFDIVVHLEKGDSPDELVSSKLSHSDYIRKLMPLSNVARKKGATDKLIQYLGTAQVYQVAGGTLQQRINFIYAQHSKVMGWGEVNLAGECASANPVPVRAARTETVPFECRKFKRDPGLLTQLLPDGHLVLTSESTSWAFTLTPVGAIVWEFCDGTNTVDSIVEQIVNLNALSDLADLRTNVTELLTELDEIGLLDY